MPAPSNRKAETPEPDNSPPVSVRARTHLAETIGGIVTRFSPGQEFKVSSRRAAALGASVEVLKPEAKA